MLPDVTAVEQWLEAKTTQVQFPPLPLRPWAGDLASLYLTFPICKMEIIIGLNL